MGGIVDREPLGQIIPRDLEREKYLRTWFGRFINNEIGYRELEKHMPKSYSLTPVEMTPDERVILGLVNWVKGIFRRR